jgi:hypothetical protein
MPLITKLGFIELWTIKALSDPTKFQHENNILLQNFQPAVWQKRGDIPRSALPAEPSAAMVQRITQAKIKFDFAPLVTSAPLPTQSPATTRASGFTGGSSRNINAQREAEQRRIREAREEEEIRKAEAELEEMKRKNEHDLERLRMDNEIEYLQAQTRMGEASLRSMDRSREVMNQIGQDRIYEREYYYR